MRNACLLALLLLIAACSKAPDPAPTAAAPQNSAPSPPKAAAADAAETGIAWVKGDVDAAFATAKAENKPVFLYWGAVWCPPCNQVKATIFNRQDFIERSRFFVPVYLDGDSRSAQRVGARFKVGGYPTMILFKPDGTEITRLPGEVDADQYMRVLAMGMNGARPVKATLQAALAAKQGGGAPALTPEDWRMLAYYSWDTNEEPLVPQKDIPATLSRLAQSCPADQAATATRLALKAIHASARAKGAKASDNRVARGRLMTVLADPAIARENFDLVTESADDVVGHVTLPKSKERAALTAAWDEALQRFVADSRLSATDRLLAVGTRVDLARLDGPAGALPDALIASVREQVARGDRETTDPYAREVVINVASQALADAGLFDESNALLTAELARSRTPYYLMLGLAANAKKQGDKAGAVDWAEKAYAAADGPATRLQWGVGYINTMVDLAPDDAARIERAATQVIGELEAVPDTFYDRNRRALERMARKLTGWSKGGQHQDSVRRIRAQLSGVCAKLPAGDPARAACDGVWNPPRAAPA
jgi:thioredoxin-related protein